MPQTNNRHNGLSPSGQKQVPQPAGTAHLPIMKSMVGRYYIGKYIVEYEQEGNVRAQYGKQVLQELSKSLTVRFGAGWSYPNLRNIRQFYIVYAKRSTTGFPFENKNANQWLANSKDSDNRTFKLSWSHYLILMRVENPDARSFYEIECVQQQ